MYSFLTVVMILVGILVFLAGLFSFILGCYILFRKIPEVEDLKVRFGICFVTVGAILLFFTVRNFYCAFFS